MDAVKTLREGKKVQSHLETWRSRYLEMGDDGKFYLVSPTGREKFFPPRFKLSPQRKWREIEVE